jgi:hypothetical protein
MFLYEASFGRNKHMSFIYTFVLNFRNINKQVIFPELLFQERYFIFVIFTTRCCIGFWTLLYLIFDIDKNRQYSGCCFSKRSIFICHFYEVPFWRNIADGRILAAVVWTVKVILSLYYVQSEYLGQRGIKKHENGGKNCTVWSFKICTRP